MTAQHRGKLEKAFRSDRIIPGNEWAWPTTSFTRKSAMSDILESKGQPHEQKHEKNIKLL